MVKHVDITDIVLQSRVRRKELVFAGNSKLRIYGRLGCKSGKRMKRENRVFFSSEKEALENNYRPCGHCMKEEYRRWIYSTKP
jgi:methylphosphotriester-DNA--protein-cysteine methyltransferase